MTASDTRASTGRAPSPAHSIRNARARFTRPTLSDYDHTNGVFLDLRQLLYALTGESHSLQSGCKAFGVPFTKDQPPLGGLTSKLITYARRDTEATRGLLEATLAEYNRRGIRLPPDQAYSVASLGKAALKQMGVRPILERQPDFPRDILGATMAAFYGGRAECHIRCTAVPIVLVDYLSNYATVCGLIGAWDYFTSERFETTELDPADIQTWIDPLTLDQLYQPETWRDLNVICWVAPGDENILPVRGRYDSTAQSDNIAVTPVTVSEPVPWMLADISAAKILHPELKPARIVRAVRIQPTGGQLADLRPLRIPGAGTIDPTNHDYFQPLVELRVKAKHDPHLDERTRDWVRKSLKTTVNATAYGINAEMNPRDHSCPVIVSVDGLEWFTTKTKAPEVPGEYCFPPLAAMITAGARLLLALLEVEVTSRGGTWAFADTDSMAIIATQTGGLIPCAGGSHRDADGRACVKALSHQQVMEIIDGFKRLNPYDRRAVPGSILEVDDASLDKHQQIRDLWVWSIAAKRYVTFTWHDGRAVLAEKSSEHGLGHISDPRDRVAGGHQTPLAADVWQYILDAELGTQPDEPEWFSRPAVTQRTISTPRILGLLGGGRRVDSELRPYSFCNHAILHSDEARNQGRERFDLVAPYEPDPRQWEATEWVDAETGECYEITTGHSSGRNAVRVKTMRDVVTLYRRKREAKSLGPDGQPCSRETIGLLRRRPVRDLTIRHIGKEANHLEDLAAGLQSADQVTAAYDHRGRGIYPQLVQPALQAFPEHMVVKATGVSRRTITRLRSGAAPDPATLRSLVVGVARLCRQALAGADQRPPERPGRARRLARPHGRSAPVPRVWTTATGRPHILQLGM